MTYRTVPRDLPLHVTGDAEPHPVHVVHLEHPRHPLDVPVASAARVGAECLDVPLMREVGVTREIVNPNPFDWLLLTPGLAQLLDLGLVGAVPPADHQVTAHAGLHR